MVTDLIKFNDLEAIKQIVNETNKNYPWASRRFFDAAKNSPAIISYLKTFIPKYLWPKEYR